jgi:hypothetical protein
MKDTTTVQLRKSVVKELKAIKKYPRQTYNEIIMDLVKRAKITTSSSPKERSQYDEFLHAMQQEKMKELWDNKEDEAWENA